MNIYSLYIIYIYFINVIIIEHNVGICTAGVINYERYRYNDDDDDHDKICSKHQYYDELTERCRQFYGGGKAILVDHTTRCANDYLGLKSHPTNEKYYYLCKKDSVVIGKCKNGMIFDIKIKKCNDDVREEMISQNSQQIFKACTLPNCTENGRFGIPSNCTMFYICDKNNKKYLQKIFKCPGSMVYNPITQKCSYTAKVTSTEITQTWDDDKSDYDEEYPPCTKPGKFRTPTDCSKYYTCSLKRKGKFYQIQHRCPHGKYYHITEEKCKSKHTVSCKYMSNEDLLELYNSLRNLKTIGKKYFDSDEELDIPKIYGSSKTKDVITVEDISKSSAESVFYKPSPMKSKEDFSENKSYEETVSNEFNTFITYDSSEEKHHEDKFEIPIFSKSDSQIKGRTTTEANALLENENAPNIINVLPILTTTEIAAIPLTTENSQQLVLNNTLSTSESIVPGDRAETTTSVDDIQRISETTESNFNTENQSTISQAITDVESSTNLENFPTIQNDIEITTENIQVTEGTPSPNDSIPEQTVVLVDQPVINAIFTPTEIIPPIEDEVETTSEGIDNSIVEETPATDASNQETTEINDIETQPPTTPTILNSILETSTTEIIPPIEDEVETTSESISLSTSGSSNAIESEATTVFVDQPVINAIFTPTEIIPPIEDEVETTSEGIDNSIVEETPATGASNQETTEINDIETQPPTTQTILNSILEASTSEIIPPIEDEVETTSESISLSTSGSPNAIESEATTVLVDQPVINAIFAPTEIIPPIEDEVETTSEGIDNSIVEETPATDASNQETTEINDIETQPPTNPTILNSILETSTTEIIPPIEDEVETTSESISLSTSGSSNAIESEATTTEIIPPIEDEVETTSEGIDNSIVEETPATDASNQETTEINDIETQPPTNPTILNSILETSTTEIIPTIEDEVETTSESISLSTSVSSNAIESEATTTEIIPPIEDEVETTSEGIDNSIVEETPATDASNQKTTEINDIETQPPTNPTILNSILETSTTEIIPPIEDEVETTSESISLSTSGSSNAIESEATTTEIIPPIEDEVETTSEGIDNSIVEETPATDASNQETTEINDIETQPPTNPTILNSILETSTTEIIPPIEDEVETTSESISLSTSGSSNAIESEATTVLVDQPVINAIFTPTEVIPPIEDEVETTSEGIDNSIVEGIPATDASNQETTEINDIETQPPTNPTILNSILETSTTEIISPIEDEVETTSESISLSTSGSSNAIESEATTTEIIPPIEDEVETTSEGIHNSIVEETPATDASNQETTEINDIETQPPTTQTILNSILETSTTEIIPPIEDEVETTSESISLSTSGSSNAIESEATTVLVDQPVINAIFTPTEVIPPIEDEVETTSEGIDNSIVEETPATDASNQETTEINDIETQPPTNPTILNSILETSTTEIIRPIEDEVETTSESISLSTSGSSNAIESEATTVFVNQPVINAIFTPTEIIPPIEDEVETTSEGIDNSIVEETPATDASNQETTEITDIETQPPTNPTILNSILETSTTEIIPPIEDEVETTSESISLSTSGSSNAIESEATTTEIIPPIEDEVETTSEGIDNSIVEETPATDASNQETTEINDIETQPPTNPTILNSILETSTTEIIPPIEDEVETTSESISLSTSGSSNAIESEATTTEIIPPIEDEVETTSEGIDNSIVEETTATDASNQETTEINDIETQPPTNPTILNSILETSTTEIIPPIEDEVETTSESISLSTSGSSNAIESEATTTEIIPPIEDEVETTSEGIDNSIVEETPATDASNQETTEINDIETQPPTTQTILNSILETSTTEIIPPIEDEVETTSESISLSTSGSPNAIESEATTVLVDQPVINAIFTPTEVIPPIEDEVETTSEGIDNSIVEETTATDASNQETTEINDIETQPPTNPTILNSNLETSTTEIIPPIEDEVETTSESISLSTSGSSNAIESEATTTEIIPPIEDEVETTSEGIHNSIVEETPATDASNQETTEINDIETQPPTTQTILNSILETSTTEIIPPIEDEVETTSESISLSTSGSSNAIESEATTTEIIPPIEDEVETTSEGIDNSIVEETPTTDASNQETTEINDIETQPPTNPTILNSILETSTTEIIPPIEDEVETTSESISLSTSGSSNAIESEATTTEIIPPIEDEVETTSEGIDNSIVEETPATDASNQETTEINDIETQPPTNPTILNSILETSTTEIIPPIEDEVETTSESISLSTSGSSNAIESEATTTEIIPPIEDEVETTSEGIHNSIVEETPATDASNQETTEINDIETQPPTTQTILNSILETSTTEIIPPIEDEVETTSESISLSTSGSSNAIESEATTVLVDQPVINAIFTPTEVIPPIEDEVETTSEGIDNSIVEETPATDASNQETTEINDIETQPPTTPTILNSILETSTTEIIPPIEDGVETTSESISLTTSGLSNAIESEATTTEIIPPIEDEVETTSEGIDNSIVEETPATDASNQETTEINDIETQPPTTPTILNSILETSTTEIIPPIEDEVETTSESISLSTSRSSNAIEREATTTEIIPPIEDEVETTSEGINNSIVEETPANQETTEINDIETQPPTNPTILNSILETTTTEYILPIEDEPEESSEDVIAPQTNENNSQSPVDASVLNSALPSSEIITTVTDLKYTLTDATSTSPIAFGSTNLLTTSNINLESTTRFISTIDNEMFSTSDISMDDVTSSVNNGITETPSTQSNEIQTDSTTAFTQSIISNEEIATTDSNQSREDDTTTISPIDTSTGFTRPIFTGILSSAENISQIGDESLVASTDIIESSTDVPFILSTIQEIIDDTTSEFITFEPDRIDLAAVESESVENSPERIDLAAVESESLENSPERIDLAAVESESVENSPERIDLAAVESESVENEKDGIELAAIESNSVEDEIDDGVNDGNLLANPTVTSSNIITPAPFDVPLEKNLEILNQKDKVTPDKYYFLKPTTTTATTVSKSLENLDEIELNLKRPCKLIINYGLRCDGSDPNAAEHEQKKREAHQVMIFGNNNKGSRRSDGIRRNIYLEFNK